MAFHVQKHAGQASEVAGPEALRLLDAIPDANLFVLAKVIKEL